MRAFQKGQKEEATQTVNPTVKGGGPKHMVFPKGPKYMHYTPLNAPKAGVLKEALWAVLLPLMQSPTPKNVD